MNQSNSIVMVITTVESLADANTLAEALVAQSSAACVQIDGPITSHYRWLGKLERTSEFRMTIKTSHDAWPKLHRTLAEIHPYDEPEIILVPITESSEGYRSWVIEQTK